MTLFSRVKYRLLIDMNDLQRHLDLVPGVNMVTQTLLQLPSPASIAESQNDVEDVDHMSDHEFDEAEATAEAEADAAVRLRLGL